MTAEREGLEGLLHTLSVLSSRNARKLGSVREDYSRLRRDLDHGKTAHGKTAQVLPGDVGVRLILWLVLQDPLGFTWTSRAGRPEPTTLLLDDFFLFFLAGALANGVAFLGSFCFASHVTSFVLFFLSPSPFSPWIC